MKEGRHKLLKKIALYICPVGSPSLPRLRGPVKDVKYVTFLAHLYPTSTMIEDDIYRSSTQYRYWSYTREALASLRQSTNELASERVRAAFGRIRNASKSSNEQESEHKPDDAHPGAQQSAKDVETLTVDEELKVVHWGCSKIIETGKVMSPPIPMEIRVR